MDAPALIVQPDDGVGPVLALLQSATRQLWLKQFTFSHPRLLEAVLACAARGVQVRVLLNGAKATGERLNDPCYERLRAAGIAVQWSSPAFLVTHEKSILVDGARALLSTFNLVEKYFEATRDYGVVLDDAAQVSQLQACFEADWSRTPFHPASGSGLAFSPGGARRILCELIDGARRTLEVQHPKFAEPVVAERLVEALARGVHVRILCGGKHGLHQPDLMHSFALWRLAHRAGAKVHKQRGLLTHAKLVLADGHRALLGSMNLDPPAFDLRREVGVVLEAARPVHALRAVFERDWEASHKYEPPSPLECLHEPQEEEGLTHE